MLRPKRPSTPERVVLSFEPDEDEPEPTSRTVCLPPRFPYLELVALGEKLDAAGVLTPCYLPPEVGLCHPNGFIFEKNFDGAQCVMLPDRNIASRMARIADGAAMDDMLRTVAGIKAFCHFLDIDMEPSISFHELAQSQGNDVANAELARFRDADNADPDAWLDLAFGDLDSLAPLPGLWTPESHDFAFPLRRWRRNYIAALKIAELELAGRGGFHRLAALLDWMRDDFMIAGPAALLACVYFAPNSAPRKGLFKRLRSAERNKALEGIRNAAWDLTHVSEMARMVNESAGSKKLIFASFDEGLRGLARLLFAVSAEELSQERISEELSAWWTVADARAIARLIAELFRGIDNEERKRRQAGAPISIDDMIRRGEAFILAPLAGQ